MFMHIAIDGPSGSGKSTVAKNIAKELGIIYVDTGAMYRALGYYFIKYNINIDDIKIDYIWDKINMVVKYENSKQIIYLENQDVTDFIRTQSVAEIASRIASISQIRKKLVALQKQISINNNVVMDGRDIATCILPNANIKIFLDASIEERARRRYFELKNNYKDDESTFEQVKHQIILRDQRDKERKESPLIRVEDAIYIDSSIMSEDEVKSFIINLIKEIK